MSTVQAILSSKGTDFWFVKPDETVYSALEILADKDIGALPVIEDGKIIGMFSERDYARKVVLKGKTSKSMLVRELMTTEVYFITPDKSIDDAMTLMTKKKSRHLPVLEKGRIQGLISIGDVVNRIINEQRTKISDLESYIMGSAYT
jgi:CBS domain-containing protein